MAPKRLLRGTRPIKEPFQNSICFDYVKEILESQETRRICFSSGHRNALRQSQDTNYLGSFTIPFDDSIYPIFFLETGLALYPTTSGIHGFWVSIHNNQQSVYEKISEFCKKYEKTVFIRDTLSLSLALGENYKNQTQRTDLGEMFYQAKYKNWQNAEEGLSNELVNFIKETPYYSDTDCIIAVPPSKRNKSNLPSRLAKKISAVTGMTNRSNIVHWKTEKPDLKNKPISEKWEALEATELVIEDKLDNDIILLDDIYQSGTTIQFVAMKLIEAGAKRIFGLTTVKARRNTDNK